MEDFKTIWKLFRSQKQGSSTQPKNCDQFSKKSGQSRQNYPGSFSHSFKKEESPEVEILCEVPGTGKTSDAASSSPPEITSGVVTQVMESFGMISGNIYFDKW